MCKRGQTPYPAEVVVGGGTAGDGREEHDNTIVRGVRGVVRGEGGVAEEASAAAADETADQTLANCHNNECLNA